MATQREFSPGDISKLLKINDDNSTLVYYVQWRHIVGILDNQTTMTMRVAVDSPGSGSNQDPVVIEITDPAEVAALREYLETAWDFELTSPIPP